MTHTSTTSGEGFYAVDLQGTATYQNPYGDAQGSGPAQHQGEQSAQHVCPTCGYCPCCGRRNLVVDPYVPYYPPYMPIWVTQNPNTATYNVSQSS